MKQSTNLCVILHVKHKKLPKSKIAAKMATMFGDITSTQ